MPLYDYGERNKPPSFEKVPFSDLISQEKQVIRFRVAKVLSYMFFERNKRLYPEILDEVCRFCRGEIGIDNLDRKDPGKKRFGFLRLYRDYIKVLEK